MKKILFLLLFTLITVFLIFSVDVTVFPNEKKQNSNIYVNKGDKLVFKTSGSWTLWDKYKPVTAVGHQVIANEFGNWGILLGMIGNGKPFIIGPQTEIISDNEGVLYLFPNKGNFKIQNPSGSIQVSVEGGVSLESFKTSLAGKAVKLSFDSNNKILLTNLYVPENSQVEIYAFGNWTLWDQVYPETTAGGHDFSVQGIPFGKLFCGIGTSFGFQTENFPVGEKAVIKTTKKGLLSFYPLTNNFKTSPKGSIEIYIIGAKELNSNEINSLDSEIIMKLQDQVLSKINEFRAASKLPLLILDQTLFNTSNNHSKYLITNNKFTQEEEEGKPFFTGKNLEERLKKENYKRDGREIICIADSYSDAINLITNSVYHRIRLLDPNLKYFGYGFFKNKESLVHVFDFGYLNDNEERPIWEYIVFPQNNMTNINSRWDGTESPDPFPLGTIKPLGYPVSIIFSKKINKVTKAEIMDEKGNQIDSFIITPDTDINNKKFNGVILVPKKVLTSNTRYIININVLFDKETNYSWSFVTKAD